MGPHCVDPTSQVILIHRLRGGRLSSRAWGMIPCCPLRLRGCLGPPPVLAGLGVRKQCGGPSPLATGSEAGGTHIWPWGSPWRWKNGQGRPLVWGHLLGSRPGLRSPLWHFAEPAPGARTPTLPPRGSCRSGLRRVSWGCSHERAHVADGETESPSGSPHKGKDRVAVTSYPVPGALGSDPTCASAELFASRVTGRRFREPLLS